MSPTREMNEEEKKEAREAAKRLEEECEHSKLSGECLLNNEMCYYDYEEQNLCPEYAPKYVNVK